MSTELLKISGRWIQSRFPSYCWRCGDEIKEGDEIYYLPVIKKACCKDCGLIEQERQGYDIEEVRAIKEARANKRADRKLKSAEIRRERAKEIEGSLPDYRHDWAFITQPGHIPGRDKFVKKEEKIIKLIDEAKELEQRAENIIHYQGRVKGDAERETQKKREEIDAMFNVGDKVFCPLYQEGILIKKNKNSFTVQFGSYILRVDKSLFNKKDV